MILRWDGGVSSTGSMASYPYAKEKGVCPVAVRAVVLYDHSTSGNSSAHAPLASSSLFLRVSFRVLFTASTCPFACGCATEEKLLIIPCLVQKSVNRSLSNWVPLSETIFCGNPYLHIMFFTTKSSTFFEVMVASGSASVHLVK